MEDTYEKVCTEVIELLKFFPKESVEKIPKEKQKLYISLCKNIANTFIKNND